MLKYRFNFVVSKAHCSVTGKDLALFEEFFEKQKAGKGEWVPNFKVGENAEGEDDDEDSGELYE